MKIKYKISLNVNLMKIDLNQRISLTLNLLTYNVYFNVLHLLLDDN